MLSVFVTPFKLDQFLYLSFFSSMNTQAVLNLARR